MKTKKAYEYQAVSLSRVILNKLSKILCVNEDTVALLHNNLLHTTKWISSHSLLQINNQSLIFQLRDRGQILGCDLLWKQATDLPAEPVPICINKLKIPYIRRGNKQDHNSRLCPVEEKSLGVTVCCVLWLLQEQKKPFIQETWPPNFFEKYLYILWWKLTQNSHLLTSHLTIQHNHASLWSSWSWIPFHTMTQLL